MSTVLRSGPLKKNEQKIRLKNVETQEGDVDSLNSKYALTRPMCTRSSCLGSVMGIPGRGDVPREISELLVHAKEFLDQYFASSKRVNNSLHEARWKHVENEILTTGTYDLTDTELAYGAKLAWRNAPRCIGRIQWSKLQIFDGRNITTTSGMFVTLCDHIKYATNKGNIRSAITVFKQRTDGKHDYRIWNNQLVGYAGYKNEDGSVLGDPALVEFTELCLNLGWKPERTAWDVLPLVLSADGKDPDFFEIPRELILEIHFSHPNLSWFEDLKIRWYGLPAVSNMRFDCGGLEFTGCAFNGWYMSTEIGCRNICDTNRLNMLEKIATRMGLDTSNAVSLWKDRALVEINHAVLHSFQLKNITIVDHHTASDSFMKHLHNESKLRSGCPSDWVWIVPPMSASVTPVFHQEMALYYIKPSYDYQDPAWKTHKFRNSYKTVADPSAICLRKKFNFRQIARAVKFTSKLFGKALSRRVTATILYATETGKSEQFAKKLGTIFGHAFNAQVFCMSDYDFSSLEHEALVIVVTSTFGNGDPPENGEGFANDLRSMMKQEGASLVDVAGKLNEEVSSSDAKSKKRSALSNMENNLGALSNVRFAVFALGSSAYPKYCKFGEDVDSLLGHLGGERLLIMETGDEMCGQDQAFNTWAGEVFKMACEAFCLADENTLSDITNALSALALSDSTVRFTVPEDFPPTLSMEEKLMIKTNKKVFSCPLTKLENLHEESSITPTIFVEFKIDDEMEYQPGDHLGVFPCNRKEIVSELLARVQGIDDVDKPIQLQLLRESHTPKGVEHIWEKHERIPICTLRELFTRFLDIASTPTPSVLAYLASCCEDAEDKVYLENLSTDAIAYEDWRSYGTPTLVETLVQFKSSKPNAATLTAMLQTLQPRFYSISSSPVAHPGFVQLTVAVVTYFSANGAVHYGVCSNYLNELQIGEEVFVFLRSAPNFHLPKDITTPIVMVGPGTGIAPFRGFWHHRRQQLKHNLGETWLFFGCRNKNMDLYHEEKQIMQKKNVLNKVFLALSREHGIPKTYVQALAEKEGKELYKIIVEQSGHFYVCGDCTMAEHICQTIKKIIEVHGEMSEESAHEYVLRLKEDNRYHEDIFGITLRTSEVQYKSRENARVKMARE